MITPAAEDPAVTTFESTVREVDGDAVVLAETYFYPEGGGQPADRGTIGGVAVADVQSCDGRIVHELAAAPPFDAGDAVTAAVDPAFRTYCQRAHTASHVLYGAARRRCADLGYGGFDIGEEKVRVDLATPTTIDDGELVELERLANRAVWESRDVTWETQPAEAALAREDVAFNVATEEGLAGDDVRIVTIEGWDVAACGGTHVRNTREIGPVAVLARSNPGEGLTRVEFAVGPTALARRATEHRAALAAAAALGTGIPDLADGVDRLQAERDALAAELEELRAERLDDRLATLRSAPVERDGRQWVVGALPTADANVLGERARAVVDGEAADAAALVSEDGAYVAVASAGAVDAEAVVDAVTDAFGGGGGGTEAAAQGGGLDADASAVVAFLRGEPTAVVEGEP